MPGSESKSAVGGGRSSLPLAELMQRDDEAFVESAYALLLGRSANHAELQPWLASIRSGALSKTDVLVAIRYSSEGRARRVQVPGIAMRRLVRLIDDVPILGGLSRWLRTLLLLPRLVRRMNASEAAIAFAEESQRASMVRMRAEYETALRQIETTKADTGTMRSTNAALEREIGRLDQVKAEMAGVARTIEALHEELRRLEESKAASTAVSGALVSLATVTADVDRVKATLHRWSLLDSGSSADHIGSDPLDEFYRRFEDRFRGSSEEIRARLAFYLPTLLEASRMGTAESLPFVDLGCGRGEMLGMLRDAGLRAYGVDRNSSMVTACRVAGLQVVPADIVDHLESLPEGSCAGIISIHVIEHLPFRSIAKLFIETLRVLCPGGIAIFETPNPENLIVGSCNFYMDPTHLKPLPPESTRFVLESFGFERVTIERLHPGAVPVNEGNRDETSQLYRTIMRVPQDYALIGYKPADADVSPDSERRVS